MLRVAPPPPPPPSGAPGATDYLELVVAGGCVLQCCDALCGGEGAEEGCGEELGAFGVLRHHSKDERERAHSQPEGYKGIAEKEAGRYAVVNGVCLEEERHKVGGETHDEHGAHCALDEAQPERTAHAGRLGRWRWLCGFAQGCGTSSVVPNARRVRAPEARLSERVQANREGN